MKTMKYYNRLTNKFEDLKVYKAYPQYGIAITNNPTYKSGYVLTDIKTGLSCGKSFTKLMDAKSFMEHPEEANFINWIEMVNKARATDTYSKLIYQYENKIPLFTD